MGSTTYTVSNNQCTAPVKTSYHTDGSGSTVLATTATGAILWKEHYSPLGERQVKSTTSTKNSQYFHGKEQDNTTGLQYFGARWYDPMVGRFMAVDPAAVDAEDEGDSGLVHEFNRYAFVANNPHKYVDPDGRMALLKIFLRGASKAPKSVPSPVKPASLPAPVKPAKPLAKNTDDIAKVGENAGKQGVRTKKVEPMQDADGPHTTWKTDPQTNEITRHETWTPNPKNPTGWDKTQSTDLKGAPHRNKLTKENIPTPHTQGKDIPGGVRPATPNEIPRR